jgi:hypothetical protein
MQTDFVCVRIIRLFSVNLCRRKTKCDYSSQIETLKFYESELSNATPQDSWQMTSAAELLDQQAFNLQQNFPAVFFLDPKVFNYCGVKIPSPISPIPPYIADYVGDARHVAAEFFDKIHMWMPVISKKRFYENLLNPLMQPRIDVSLLIYCMKLITVSPSKNEDGGNPKTTAYLTAKRLLLEAEIAGVLSLQLLQAGLLVTIYEIGHAIYPLAYTSLGTWARYGVSLGINGKQQAGSPGQFTWVEEEERRRVWWAILILDRFVFSLQRFFLNSVGQEAG